MGKGVKYLQLASHGGVCVCVCVCVCVAASTVCHRSCDGRNPNSCLAENLYALYLLGTINAEGNGVKRSCNFGVEVYIHRYLGREGNLSLSLPPQLLKSVSERGAFIRMFSEARRLYTVGDVESSFLMYCLLAELGFEEAQSNVAYLLEQG